MYIPNSFRLDNRTEIVSFMKRYSFATLVTHINGKPVASHLPFSIIEEGETILLSSHLSTRNEQAEFAEQGQCLIIFSEPHAYISPSLYDKKESVPTWDYISVHAYGQARILLDEQAKLQALERMIEDYEPGYMAQWKSLPDKFKMGMMNGIVAFEIEVRELQAQKKLSQNKSSEERKRIVEHLNTSSSTNEREIAAYIEALG